MLSRAWVILVVLLPTAAVVHAAPEGVLGALEAEVQAIVARTAPAVVRVEARKQGVLTMDRPDVELPLTPTITESSVGAGFVAGPERFILASHSVVEGAEDIRVTFPGGLRTAAQVIDTNAFFRVAVLRADEMPERLEPLELADRESRPGSFAILCGRSQDAGPSALLGLVGDTGRAYQGFDRFLVVSVPLTPGESGAPFVGSDGKVLGLGSAALADRDVVVRFGVSSGSVFRTQGSSSRSLLACCVPADDLRRILADVTRHGRIQQAWLGVTLMNEEPVITGVVEKSPAEGAELRPGDRIRALEGEEVTSRMQLVGRLARLRPGTVVTFRIEREGEARDVPVPLLLRPRSHERDLLREKAGIRVMRVPDSCGALIQVGDLIEAVNDEPAVSPAVVRAALTGWDDPVRVDIVVVREGQRIRMSNR